jgi:hypothetical protein
MRRRRCFPLASRYLGRSAVVSHRSLTNIYYYLLLIHKYTVERVVVRKGDALLAEGGREAGGRRAGGGRESGGRARGIEE